MKGIRDTAMTSLFCLSRRFIIPLMLKIVVPKNINDPMDMVTNELVYF